MNQELSTTVGRLIETYFPQLRRTVRKNLTRLTCAFLRLALSVRFGYGGLHLTSVARVLPQGVNFKSSYKWLSRFLKCKYFDPSSLAECMLALILGRKPPPWVIVLVDQTTIDGVEVVNAAIPLEGRAVPVAWIDFEYPWKTLAPASQNTIERYLLTWLAEAAPPCTRLMLVFDRGYARVELIKDLNRGQQPFLIRAPGKVIVQAMVRGRRQRLSLGRLPHRTNWPVRYGHVLYHSQKAEPVDGIYLGLSALAVVGPGSASREAASLFRATTSARPSRHTENPECPLDGPLSTLRSALGTTDPRTLDANSFPSCGWSRDCHAFFLLALKIPRQLRKIPVPTILKGQSLSHRRVHFLEAIVLHLISVLSSCSLQSLAEQHRKKNAILRL